MRAAAAADVAIVAIGTMACGCCKRCGNGEVGDRMSLEPEGRQLELLASVLNATKGTKTKVRQRPFCFTASLLFLCRSLPFYMVVLP